MRDLSVPIVTITGVVHLVRGAEVDAVVFLAVAAALLADARFACSRPSRPRAVISAPRVEGTAGSQLESPAPQFEGAAGSPPRRRLAPPAVLLVSGLAALVLAWGARFNLALTLVAVALGVVAVATAWPQPVGQPTREPTERLAWPWAVAALAWCLLELTSFLHELAAGASIPAHPTFSSLIGPVLDNRIVLWLAIAGWLAGGVALVRMARQEEPA